MLLSLPFISLLELALLLPDIEARAVESSLALSTTEHVFPLMRRKVGVSNKISHLPGLANLTSIGGGLAFSTKVSLGEEVRWYSSKVVQDKILTCT